LAIVWLWGLGKVAGAGTPPVRTGIVGVEGGAGASAAGAMELVRRLASEALAGRGVDSAGLDSAAALLEREMRGMGLVPMGSQGFRQPFEVAIGVVPSPESRLRIGGVDAAWRPVGQGWVPEGASADGKLEDQGLFLWPGSLPEEPHGLQGRAVLVLEGGATADTTRIPPWQLNPWGYLTEQAHRAAAAGARALLLATLGGEDTTLTLPDTQRGYVTAPIPILRLAPSVARRILEAAGKDPRSPGALENVALDLDLSLERRRRVLHNLLGAVPGNGEWVLLGAHYDGLGRPEGVVHPGADDNASGVAAVLEVARRLERRPGGRGVLVVLFSGEEIGLAGSRHLADRLPVPRESLAVVVNVDMVGRLGEGKLIVMGGASGEGLDSLVQAVARQQDPPLPVALGGDPGTPSDQAPFYAAGIPVLHVMTPPHGDYHRPTDTWEKLDPQGLARVIGFLGSLVERLREPPRPAYHRVASALTSRGAGRGFRASLGTIPDFTYEGGDGVRLSGVKPGSPAERAGLREGDLLVGMDGTPIRSLRDFVGVLRRHEPGDQVEVVVLRDGTEVRVKVTLVERK
jgi:hypothetical protein